MLKDRTYSRLLKEITARKKELLSKYTFSLDESKKLAIDKIYSEAVKKLSK
ncbi:MAG: hypothetical protein Q7J27_10855 [Syntrophales bacterium]|nr:hypothetical protein [Syntrophales bacterium]